jgi:hypothetical protein
MRRLNISSSTVIKEIPVSFYLMIITVTFRIIIAIIIVTNGNIITAV